MKRAILSFDKRIVEIIITFLDIMLKKRSWKFYFEKMLKRAIPQKAYFLPGLPKMHDIEINFIFFK
jgi:hypothetical protein